MEITNMENNVEQIEQGVEREIIERDASGRFLRQPKFRGRLTARTITPQSTEVSREYKRDPQHGGKFTKGTKGGRLFVAEPIVANLARHSTFEYVPFENLAVDKAYQRDIDKTRVSKMAHNWDADLAGAIVVSRRSNGLCYVVDGQHRYASLNMLANKPTEVWAEVHRDLTLQQEAQLFYELDTKRAGLTSGAAFTALVAANDPMAMGIVRAAESAGMTADYRRGPIPNNLRAFATMMRVYRRTTHTQFERILRVLHAAWPDSPDNGMGFIIEGLEYIFQKYPKIDERALVKALATTTPAYIQNNARILNGTLSSALRKSVALVIHGLYNKGKRTHRLAPWQD